MIPTTQMPAFDPTGSGIRRITVAVKGSLWKWFKTYFIPMAPKKKEDPENPDKSVMAWRAFQTAFIGYVTILLTQLANGPSAPNGNAALDHRMTALEQKVDRIERNVEKTAAYVEGLANGKGARR